MVPRFEKRVRAFATNMSGLMVVVLLTAFGLPDFEFKSLVRSIILLVAFNGIIIIPLSLKSRQTFGQRINKIKTVNLDDSEPTLIKLIFREIFKYTLSLITFGVYLVVAYFALSEQHVSRTIHDYVFKTKVIDLDNSPQNKHYNDAIRTKTMKDTDLR